MTSENLDQQKNQSVLSRLKNPWEKDRTIEPKFKLGDKVKIEDFISIPEAEVVKIQLNASADETVPRHLQSPLPVYKCKYKSEEEYVTTGWQAEHSLEIID